jgi:hypothetical protein
VRKRLDDVLICISFMTKDVEYFVYLLAIFTSVENFCLPIY